MDVHSLRSGADRNTDQTVADALYSVIHARRDVRSQFTGEPIHDATLQRILKAAHAAPSVGLTQPWDFILVSSSKTKEEFWVHVQQERALFAETMDEELVAKFQGIKIEGIREASLGVVVTYDPQRGKPHVIGRNTIDDAGLYSVCLAIENLWLSATAEGLGVGWVSFYREEFLADLLHIPEPIRPVAWLCLGPVTHLEPVPDLERAGWRGRMPLSQIVHHESW